MPKGNVVFENIGSGPAEYYFVLLGYGRDNYRFCEEAIQGQPLKKGEIRNVQIPEDRILHYRFVHALDACNGRLVNESLLRYDQVFDAHIPINP